MSSTKEKKKSFIEENPALFGICGTIIAICIIYGLFMWKTTRKLPLPLNFHADNLDNNNDVEAGAGAGAGAGL
mgnify:CR=1 FL=1